MIDKHFGKRERIVIILIELFVVVMAYDSWFTFENDLVAVAVLFCWGTVLIQLILHLPIEDLVNFVKGILKSNRVYVEGEKK